MLYYLFEYLENQHQLPGASLFQFLSFRAAVAVLISLMFSTLFGKKIIEFLKRKQIGETVRELGLDARFFIFFDLLIESTRTGKKY